MAGSQPIDSTEAFRPPDNRPRWHFIFSPNLNHTFSPFKIFFLRFRSPAE